MILTGVGFKLSLVPFHLWTPDVYEGAPAPVTAFIATVSKGAMFALLLRTQVAALNPTLQTAALTPSAAGESTAGPILLLIALIAAASMIAGNFLALLQSNVKRILAYSSIAQMGYILVAFLAAGRLAIETVTFYLVTYFVTTLGAFGVVTSRAQLEEKLYGWGEEIESNAVEVYIHGLRRKLGQEFIRTVRGVGYMVPKAPAGKSA